MKDVAKTVRYIALDDYYGPDEETLLLVDGYQCGFWDCDCGLTHPGEPQTIQAYKIDYEMGAWADDRDVVWIPVDELPPPETVDRCPLGSLGQFERTKIVIEDRIEGKWVARRKVVAEEGSDSA